MERVRIGQEGVRAGKVEDAGEKECKEETEEGRGSGGEKECRDTSEVALEEMWEDNAQIN